MPPQETQQELSPEDSKAALGLTTRLTEQFLMSQVPQEGVEGEETQESAPGPKQPQEAQEDTGSQIESLKTEIMDELASIREEIKAKGGDEEIEDLKKEIEAVLNEDTNEQES